MIEYIRDLQKFSCPIDKFPHTLEGMIAIFSRNGEYMRCPAWGEGQTIVKVDKDYVYVQSDTAGKIDLFNEHGDKVKQISAEELK
jgi:hypothetical protein